MCDFLFCILAVALAGCTVAEQDASEVGETFERGIRGKGRRTPCLLAATVKPSSASPVKSISSRSQMLDACFLSFQLRLRADFQLAVVP